MLLSLLMVRCERYYGEGICGKTKKVQMPVPLPSLFGRQLREDTRPDRVCDGILPEQPFSLWQNFM